MSLIVCTQNRSGKLAASLTSIGKLKCTVPWELVVVDNGSTDETREVVSRASREFPVPVRYIFEPKPGLGNAHNAAVREAESEIVAFTDDDCYPNDDFLEAHWQCFSENSSLGFVGGRILLHDPDDIPVTIQPSETRREIPPRSFLPAGVIQGANFACRREAFLAVGGSDPWFGPGAQFNAEEIDLLSRISAIGWHGAYDPRPTVYHHHGRKAGDEINLYRSYDRGRGAYYAKSLLEPKLSRVYFRAWLASIKRAPVRQSYREIAAGAEFLVRAMLDGGTRFRSRGRM